MVPSEAVEGARRQIKTLAEIKAAVDVLGSELPADVKKKLEPRPRASGSEEITNLAQIQRGSFVRVAGLQCQRRIFLFFF
eukprot:853998-Rhodomonas_salina.1